MTIPILTFFNNKGGVGKTTLIHHLSWIFSELNHRVLAVDLDPQANLTAAFFEDDAISTILEDTTNCSTIYKAILPIATGTGNAQNQTPQKITDNLYVLPGDIQLSDFEEILSEQWTACYRDGPASERGLNVTTAFWNTIQASAKDIQATIILMDIGPNLGAINRSALIATTQVIFPLGADLFSLRGLENLGVKLKKWKTEWTDIRSRQENQNQSLTLPEGAMTPIGYLCNQPIMRLDRPIRAYAKWINRIPSTYHTAILNKTNPLDSQITPEQDPNCLTILKHYRSLMPMALEARKPVFKLTPADGAIGSHMQAVHAAFEDFKALAEKISSKINLPDPRKITL